MAKTQHTIYILIAIFSAYFVCVFLENNFWGNVLAPAITFIASFFIFTAIKKMKQMDERKFYGIALFLFTFSWGIADFFWLIYDNILFIDPTYVTFINVFYTLPNIFLALALTFYYINNFKKWNKYQLILDSIAIDSVLLLFLWIFIFSKTGFKLENNFEYINTMTYLFLDFYSLSAILTMGISFRLKKLRKNLLIVFAGALVFVFTDFYYAYLYFMKLYHANSMVDGIYMLSNVLFALAAIWPQSLPSFEQTEEEEMLPENYRKSRYLSGLLLIFLFLYMIRFFEFKTLMAFCIIIIVHQFLSMFVQDVIHKEYLLKKEVSVNGELENIIKKRTAELVYANEALREISNKDALTGLYNRRYLMDYLDLLTLNSNKEPFAVLYMDLDRFKSINDSYGHQMGDQVLCTLSNRFLENFSANCTSFRVGGDEFVLLIENEWDRCHLKMIAEKVLNLVQLPIIVEPYVFHTSVSIGIALYPEDASDRDLLMKYADIAMYEVKTNSYGSYFNFFHSEISKKIERQHELEVLLKNVDYESEFVLYYQPQYRVCDHTLVGVEALLRWKHPQKGMIPPLEFIPIAEEIGVINEIGKWVIEEAFHQIKKWNEMYGLNLKVGINVSPIQVADIQFVTWFQDKLKSEKVNPNWIDLEVTEGSAMNATLSMQEVFTQFSEMGVAISIDDFGTGYSSLSYIKRFNINTLKIAKELINNISDDKNTLLIVQAIIMMTKGMQLKVIAEGVEDSEQLEILEKLGCDEIQGYFFGKPVPADELEKEHILKQN